MIRKMMKPLAIATLCGALLSTTLVPAHALSLPSTFISLSKSPTLRSPGILVIDPDTGQTIFEHSPGRLRAPASVLKLISTTTALKTFGPEKEFVTTISETSDPSTFILSGDRDPWLTASAYEAKKYHRAYIPALVNAVLAAHSDLKAITLEYANVNVADLTLLQHFFHGRVEITVMPLTNAQGELAQPTKEISKISSPALSEIIAFTLLYSDNQLANRLAVLSAKNLGFVGNVTGIQSAFEKTLKELNVPTGGLLVQDGSGLSHATRVSTNTIASLLVEIKKNPDLHYIYDGLPLAGETGTLKHRFVKDAPKAVGLVKAKTGWIDNTVSLAGYVTVGTKQYVFAFIADHIINRESARSAARETIDKMLASIAKPAPKTS
jgi:D-alanyl-D-alanine carboxypeptidase